MSSAMVAEHLNDMHRRLKAINDDYSRHQGTMMVVSPDTEDKIEIILRSMKLDVDHLKTLTDDQIAVFTDDVGEYRNFLAMTDEVIKNNMDEVINAREFLSSQYSP